MTDHDHETPQLKTATELLNERITAMRTDPSVLRSLYAELAPTIHHNFPELIETTVVSLRAELEDVEDSYEGQFKGEQLRRVMGSFAEDCLDLVKLEHALLRNTSRRLLNEQLRYEIDERKKLTE